MTDDNMSIFKPEKRHFAELEYVSPMAHRFRNATVEISYLPAPSSKRVFKTTGDIAIM